MLRLAVFCALIAFAASQNSTTTTTTEIPTTNTTSAPVCPPGWRMFNNYCYVLIPRQSSRAVENYCQSKFGAHSASVHSENEIRFVINMSYDYSDKWIGLFSDDNSVTWTYTDGTKFDFQQWANGWPQIDTSPCAVTDGSSYITTCDCGTEKYGVCKKPAKF